ncbi:hypothetical protein BTVI_69731 [Pitangus sulphuratus]|nr:hypothetical protein BTVI_69731 [Pitangus sulphuratus]
MCWQALELFIKSALALRTQIQLTDAHQLPEKSDFRGLEDYLLSLAEEKVGLNVMADATKFPILAPFGKILSSAFPIDKKKVNQSSSPVKERAKPQMKFTKDTKGSTWEKSQEVLPPEFKLSVVRVSGSHLLPPVMQFPPFASDATAAWEAVRVGEITESGFNEGQLLSKEQGAEGNTNPGNVFTNGSVSQGLRMVEQGCVLVTGSIQTWQVAGQVQDLDRKSHQKQKEAGPESGQVTQLLHTDEDPTQKEVTYNMRPGFIQCTGTDTGDLYSCHIAGSGADDSRLSRNGAPRPVGRE